MLDGIRPEFPDVRIIFLTMFAGDAEIQRAFEAGAQGNLLKSMPPDQMVETIRQVYAGIASDVAEHLCHEPLTGRESTRSLKVQPTRSRHATGSPSIESASAKEFPPFRLDMVNQCLWRRGEEGEDERVLLTPKAFGVLRYLVAHAGRLVTQDELLEAVWPDTFVQPEVLKYQIADIRRLLGDSPKNPLFIETLPRRGYQFIAAVSDGTPANLAWPATTSQSGLVGRDRGLGELWDYLRKALNGQGQIVLIAGKPDIAKATLADG